MKPNHPIPPMSPGRRLACPVRPLRSVLSFLAVVAALALSACDGPKTSADRGAEIRQLETRLDEFGSQLLTVTEHADRSAFWQTVASCLLLAAMIAFVGGAAMGSRARRETNHPASPASSAPSVDLAEFTELSEFSANGDRPYARPHPVPFPEEIPVSRRHESSL